MENVCLAVSFDHLLLASKYCALSEHWQTRSFFCSPEKKSYSQTNLFLNNLEKVLLLTVLYFQFLSCSSSWLFVSCMQQQIFFLSCVPFSLLLLTLLPLVLLISNVADCEKQKAHRKHNYLLARKIKSHFLNIIIYFLSKQEIGNSSSNKKEFSLCGPLLFHISVKIMMLMEEQVEQCK